MDTVISFTPGQIIAAAGGLTAICVAVGWVIKIVKAAKAPTERLEKRIAALEDEVETYRAFFANDKRRLDLIEEGSRVTMRAILALLSHGIDGNDVEGLKTAKNEIQQYLIERPQGGVL